MSPLEDITISKADPDGLNYIDQAEALWET
jgi:hypothetical protein